MYKYEVGQLFQEGITKYQEGTKFDFDIGGASLLLFFNRPTQREIDIIRKSEITAAIYEKDEIIFMMYKFQGLEWLDTSFNMNMSKLFGICPVKPGQGYMNNIFLIDASTGIIKVMRMIGWTEKFSRKFYEFVMKQKDMPFDESEYNKKIDVMYRNYTIKTLVARADHIEKLVNRKDV